MGLGVNVWIHANRDRRGFAHGTGDFRQDLEFRFGFDIEAVDTHFQSPAHFARLFAYAAKHDFGWVATCQNDTFSSPWLTMSKPAPACAKHCKTAKLELAFMP